jgi:phosphate uptake regulator
VRIHLAREHAAELEQLELLREVFDLADEIVERARVFFLARELVELAGLVERLLDAVQRGDDGLELRALAA